MFRNLGFTMVELLITIIIIGLALSALMSALSTAVVQGAAPVWETRALALAQAYADEILAMRFDDLSPSGGGQIALSDNPCVMSNEDQSREQFDDVDDYHDLADKPPRLIQSILNMDTYAQYEVRIDVDCAGLELGMNANHLIKRIRIQVQTPTGDIRRLAFYRGNF